MGTCPDGTGDPSSCKTEALEICRSSKSCENASQVAEILNGVYGADTVTANYVQFRLHRFCSGIFDVNVAPRPSSKSHLSEVGFKKKLDVWVPHQITPKSMMDRISICEALAKQNEIDAFLKRMGQTLNSDIYCQHLERFKLVTDYEWRELANRRGVAFHQDNARPHTSVVTRQKLWDFDWKVLMHPLYSPNLAPNDYHLFLALQNFQGDKKLG
ncbi:histonelysine Nmethyltransferase SETMARlike [Trichonephila clavipes]|nr:histonelysine Nmethyltransferase SETMARlike [Trichonephila clavipes]